MKAIVQKKYGSFNVFNLEEVERPKVKDNEVLIKVHAASISYSNLIFMKGKPAIMRLGLGLFKPKLKIPGCEVAGEIIDVFSDSKFKIGDKVFVDLSDCGRGGFAQYVAVSEKIIELIPNNINYELAAAVPEAALVALQALRDGGNIKSGEKVLIYGASGGIGTYAVQIAKALGAEVTGVCSSRNLELVKSLGADYVIDYTKEDFLKSNKKYDIILSTAGYRSIFDYKKALTTRGRYISTGGFMSQILQALLLGPFLSSKKRKKLSSFLVKPNKDLNFIKKLIEEEKVTPVIDKVYSLEEISEAMEYYAKGHSKGRVVLAVSH